MIRKNINIEKARRILAQKGVNLTDRQIAFILNTLYTLCEQVTANIEKGKA